MGNQENKQQESEVVPKQSSAEKPKIKPSLKINPNAKDLDNDNDEKVKKEETNAIIMQRLKDLENQQKEIDQEKTIEDAKYKIATEIKDMSTKVDSIYNGTNQYAEKSEDDRIKELYELYSQISQSNHEELCKFVEYNLEYDEHNKLYNFIIQDVNKEETTIQKLKIIIRDLQEKTPLIHDEVQSFIEDQKKWRVEKEEEFQKSIENIRSQMTPSVSSESSPEGEIHSTPESAMQAKYKELWDYVENMKKEVDQFKEARENLISERDEKIKELEDTKNNKLVDSKRNIQEKIQALKQESSKLKKELPNSRKDYSKHKNESK